MLRVSTEEQAQGYGLDVQEAAGREYISRQPGWILPPELIFRDEGVSGSIIDRPEMLRLEAAAKMGLIDVIVVHKFDRIGRTGRAFWTWIWAMEDLGISFVSVTQNIDTTTTFGQQQLQFHAMMAEAEWNLIRERTQSGRQRKAIEGGWPGGPPPWGYSIEGVGKRGSKLVINEDEARTIFQAVYLIVDKKMNVSEAAQELNVLGMLTRSGKPWTASNLHRRLRSNALLKAEVIFRNPDGSGRNRTKLDQEGVPLHGQSVTISIPRILSKERAKALEKAMAKNGHTSHAAAGDYPLSGRIKGKCGYGYVGAYRKTDDTRYYRCGGSNNGKGKVTGCTDPYITASDIEAAVWAEVITLLSDPARLETLAEEWVKGLPGDIEKQRTRVADFEKALQEKEAAAARAVVDFARNADLDQSIKDAAMKTLNEDVKAARGMVVKAKEVLAEQEKAEAHTKNVMTLTEIARENLRDLALTEMGEVIELLDLQVTPMGEVRKRSGVKCKVTEWHEETGTPVPAEVPEEAWPAVEELMTDFFGRRQFTKGAYDIRTQVNGALHRLRTGGLWDELPERYGPWVSVKERQNAWFKKGFWPVLVTHLNFAGGGTPVEREPQLPPLRITGRITAELVTDLEVDRSGREGGKEVPPNQRFGELASRRPST
ncbi:recombinase family protein [Streptomyces smyrnaeus]|uniref:recombinase family protein n=1 Tax=Streptomyces smyrnaeus TaxID=1387713 RepID=UPI0036C4CA18